MTNEEATDRMRAEHHGRGWAAFDSRRFLPYQVGAEGVTPLGAGHSWEEAFEAVKPVDKGEEGL